MKYFNYLVMAIFAICVTSCGNGGIVKYLKLPIL